MLIVVTALIFIGIGVFATVSYQASEIGYANGSVKDAIDDLYTKTPKKFCELKSGTANTIGSKYECDPGDSVKRNFYVLSVRSNSIDLIMERNITEGSGTSKMTWMNAMTYIDDNNLKSSWNNVIDIDLPMAQDIANAVGNTSWKVGTKNYNDWFYFDNKAQTLSVNATNLSNYSWLYNYTRECSNYGCDASTSLGSTEAYGYWTRDIVAQQLDTTGRAWFVHRYSGISSIPVTDNSNYGVRLVITVLKSNLYE